VNVDFSSRERSTIINILEKLSNRGKNRNGHVY